MAMITYKQSPRNSFEIFEISYIFLIDSNLKQIFKASLQGVYELRQTKFGKGFPLPGKTGVKTSEN